MKSQSKLKNDKQLHNNIDSAIYSASNDLDRLKEAKLQQKPNYESETKLEIMSTLLNINGTMKEFAEDIESKMSRAFKSKAGKKYGMSEVDIELKRA